MTEDAENGQKHLLLGHTDESQTDSTTIDLDTLNLVEDVIRRVKESGGALGAIDAFDNDAERDDCEHTLSLSKFQSKIERIKRFKDALTLLQNGATSAQALNRRNAAYASCGQGIGRLPDEVLSRIFVQICDWREGINYASKALIVLASVCMRFRIIILAMSRSWSHICSSMSPNLIDMHLVHSREQPLVIWCESSTSMHRQYQWFCRILPHAYRWEKVTISYWLQDDLNMYALRTDLKRLTLPKIHTLEITFPTMHDIDRDDDDEKPEDIEFHVYRTWDAPSLRVLNLIRSVPRACQQLQLTSCSINLDLEHWIKPYDALGTFLSFLESQPTLEELDFVVNTFPGDSEYPATSRVDLPILKRMTLRVAYRLVWGTPRRIAYESGEEDTTNYVIPKVLSHLVTPSLVRLCIELLLAPEIRPTVQLRDLFPAFNMYTHMENLRLTIYNAWFEGEIPPFPVIFTRMPALKHLYLCILWAEISGTVRDSNDSNPIIRPPPLRTMHLDVCRNLNESSLCEVVEFLSSGETWDEFELLKVTNCGLLGNCAEALSRWLDSSKISIETAA